MEITQNTLAFVFTGVAVITLAIIIIGSHRTKWTTKKDHNDTATKN